MKSRFVAASGGLPGCGLDTGWHLPWLLSALSVAPLRVAGKHIPDGLRTPLLSAPGRPRVCRAHSRVSILPLTFASTLWQRMGCREQEGCRNTCRSATNCTQFRRRWRRNSLSDGPPSDALTPPPPSRPDPSCSYERTFPMFNYTREDCGTAYITIGACCETKRHPALAADGPAHTTLADSQPGARG